MINNGCNGISVSHDSVGTFRNVYSAFNMFGILIWLTYGRDIADDDFQIVCNDLEKDLESNNQLLYNTIGSACLRPLPEGMTLVSLAG